MLTGDVPWDPGGSNVVKVWPQAEGCAAIASKASNTIAPVRRWVPDFIVRSPNFRFSDKRSWVQVCLGERDNCVPRTVLCLCRSQAVRRRFRHWAGPISVPTEISGNGGSKTAKAKKNIWSETPRGVKLLHRHWEISQTAPPHSPRGN